MTYQSWHGRWASRHEQTFTVVEVQDPGPSANYLRWWYLAARRFLAPNDAFYPRPPDEIPPETIQRIADTPVGGNQVDDVLDNRRPGRRRMVGTRTTIGIGSGSMRCLETRPLHLAVLDPHGSASSSHQAGPSQPSEVPATPQHHFDSSTPVFGSPSQDFMVGLNSPGFQRTLQQLMVDDTTYRPGFDGSQVQVHMDLNEPASAPSHLFTAYAGTLASVYMQDAHFMDPYPISPQAPEDPLQTIHVAMRELHPSGGAVEFLDAGAVGQGAHVVCIVWVMDFVVVD
ncbi:hypothetical protein PIB30_062131 [Stylosanthes scabra]|uniref:Uncharacterized protein n=1 Tax=Stylosanthes scabra TaxID=79078 RepID=A0ABU6ZJS7_9FABA|nr:hypothetical protein [Stylosanthes scabra]